MKCVFKNQNSTEPYWNQFDGLALESDKNKVIQWTPEFIQKFINAPKPVWISHYGENSPESCAKIYNDLQKAYGPTSFGLACSVYNDKYNTYIHYGGDDTK